MAKPDATWRRTVKQPYDPLDPETWPDEQYDAMGCVWSGLRNGDLRPFADYLRAGYYIEPSVAAQIADAIDGKEWGRYRIIAKAKKPGEKGADASAQEHDRKMRIGVYFEKLVREYGESGWEVARDETAKRFEVGHTTANKHRNYVLDYMDRAQAAPGFDLWKHLSEFYFTPSD